MINSRLSLFTATHLRGLPFSLGYGVNLPSSLTTLLPPALGSSPHLPVSVCGTDATSVPYTFSRLITSHFPTVISVPYDRGNQRPAATLLSVSILKWWRLRNFYRMCIGYASLPRLSFRLTRGGRACPRKPQIFGHYDSHIILATHSGILSCIRSHGSLRYRFFSYTTLPYPAQMRSLSFGCMLSPVKSSAQLHSTSELLRTL